MDIEGKTENTIDSDHPWKIIDKELAKMDKSIDKTKMLETLLDAYMKMQNIYPYFVLIMQIPMDIYFLSRLFIKFDKRKMKTRGPESCRSAKYRQIKNAIMYGGAAHIMIYVTFFNLY